MDERAFHRWLTRTLPAGGSGALPLGDDAAALTPPRGTVAILSTDALVEGYHFLRASPPRAVGRAATAVSLSDAAAKGAAPAGVLLDLLVPVDSPEAWLRSVVTGAEEMAARFGAHVVGGDTKASPTRTVVSTVLAWGDPHRLAPRSGARPGDLIVTTGSVGRGGVAWERFRRSSSSRRPGRLRELLEVDPRVLEGRRLARFAHAMLDTSDGLADASWLMSRSSSVRIVLDEELIPWARGVEGGDPARRRAMAFYGGDYELLAAIPSSAAPRAMRIPGAGATVIGRVEPGGGAYLRSRGRLRPLPLAGWQPFRRRAR